MGGLLRPPLEPPEVDMDAEARRYDAHRQASYAYSIHVRLPMQSIVDESARESADPHIIT